jgi:hypothetical protein
MNEKGKELRKNLIIIEQMEEAEAEVTFGWQYANVFLNGKEAKLCSYANAKEGYIIRAKCDENGIIIRDGKLVYEKIFGDVSIEVPTMVDENGDTRPLFVGNFANPGDHVFPIIPQSW